ncbi:Sec-independent protein translocase subunit TatA [Microbacterium sp. zg.Y1090]|uniref:Sec-independent protein translocase subunit TatA n=1 Tax=Microbacterium TaxID=33882 RepID=UPI00214C4EF9|nr:MULTISPECIES: Sec-independent protein translocase subunit TatA [unclassified Microbacterium]MCR2811959.1 Sec-independent protein translocase subunit TatA [Microbacterium sp. zg.Y1084]MCR2818602.1 Sec-independent protein translocase subunit TatA [Microbacterium sp. zg.Y1090]MDL5486416.1 Sec-independent protein translocase subunit TatA [Microbacterium sp. zg-Y1211]WIM29719.1 Sec-independent protein translocase subunit TatA [Microbacterium sp. zg-Y1090]
MGIHGWQWLLVLAVILLLFGAAKLPALAKSMGQSARVFKSEMKAMKEEDTSSTPADGAASPTSAAPSTVAPEVHRDANGSSSTPR